MQDSIHQKLEHCLNGLKRFQRASVERLVEQYNDPEHSGRMLVADEVGLGKTIVAKGVIARLLSQHIQVSKVKQRPFRVTYICSNLALARENQQKLALFKEDDAKKWVKQPSFGRLVELAVEPNSEDEQSDAIIEVCSLTPTTSFTLTAGTGSCRERAIIAVLLANLEPLRDYSEQIIAFMKTDRITKEGRWEQEIRLISDEFTISGPIRTSVAEKMSQPYKPESSIGRKSTYYDIAQKLASAVGDSNQNNSDYNLFLIEIRKLIASCCAANLEADLFILDEFQRFQALTDTESESEESMIARQVFHASQGSDHQKSNVKVLMLSATPFKAVTMLNEESTENTHHKQLKKLLSFMSSQDQIFMSKFENELEKIQRELLKFSNKTSAENKPIDDVIDHKTARALEKLLQQYICRTERAQINGEVEKLISSKKLICDSTFSLDDVKGYRAIETIKSRLGRGQFGARLIDFVKSAPWCMSFLHGYAFKKTYLKHLSNNDNKEIRTENSDEPFLWLKRSNIESYKLNVETGSPNAKVRAVTKIVFDGGPENLLWTPPSKPYYPLTGIYENSENFTKTLLFSSWAAVPKALSTLWSYEAERRVLRGNNEDQIENYFLEDKSSLLQFKADGSLNPWHLLYPCKSLMQFNLNSQSLDSLVDSNIKLITPLLSALRIYVSDEQSSKDWYVLAPMLLDRHQGNEKHLEYWLEEADLAHRQSANSNEKLSGRQKQLTRIKSYIEQGDSLSLGKIPDDLAKVLAYSAIANPALCALRAMHTHWKLDLNDNVIIQKSLRFAEQSVRLFNHDYAKPIIDRNITNELSSGYTKSPNWYKVLVYCAHGNYQSMLDEFCHMLATSGHDIDQSIDKFQAATGIRSVSEQVHFWEDKNEVNHDASRIRCHFAVSMGKQNLQEDSGLKRVVNVRDAFNSPFRPFVLSSTSIGQEGLDFHWYCRRVVHWNLPNNPIDIEQREGRVNRYKSFVTRKRLAETTDIAKTSNIDIWEQIFNQASAEIGNNQSGLEPFWFYSKGSAQIERIVPMFPMSREVRKYDQILKILVLYRLAFGQPRQEELLENLLESNLTASERIESLKGMMINLSPLLYTDKNS